MWLTRQESNAATAADIEHCAKIGEREKRQRTFGCDLGVANEFPVVALKVNRHTLGIAEYGFAEAAHRTC